MVSPYSEDKPTKQKEAERDLQLKLITQKYKQIKIDMKKAVIKSEEAGECLDNLKDIFLEK
jgi:hypothetical protein